MRRFRAFSFNVSCRVAQSGCAVIAGLVGLLILAVAPSVALSDADQG